MTHPEQTASGQSPLRRRLGALLRSKLFRAGVSIALLGLLLAKLNLGELGKTLGNVSPGLLALGVFVFLTANMVSVFKWRKIIEAQGTPVNYFYLTTLFYIGLFFNNFLPTNFGGDVVKAFKLARVTGRGADAAGSVVLDRASSIFALLAIAIIPALFELRLLGTGVVVLVIAMFAFFLLLVLVVANEKAARRLGGLRLFRLDPFGVRRHLKNFYYSLHDFRGRPGTLGAVVLISLAYQGLQITTVWVLALSLGIDVAPVYYFIFIPVVLAVSMVPLSLNGLGIREGAWVLLFSQVGISAAEAFSMSILSFLVMTVVSLAGGVFYMFDRATPAAGDAPATQGETSHGRS